MTLKLLGWLVLLAGIVPLLAATWVSFSPDSLLTPPTGEWSAKWYRRFFTDPRWSAALVRSLVVAGLTAVACVALALPVALSSRRWSRAAVLLPAVIPPAALGLGLLPVFHRSGLWGTTAGVLLAHAALGLPVAYLILRGGIGGELRASAEAGRLLGASEWQVFARVTLPLLRPAILTALAAVFVLSWNEAVVTAFVSGPSSETLPVVMWSQLRGSASPLVAVASTLAVAVALLPLLAFPARPNPPGRTR